MLLGLNALATCLDSQHSHGGVIQERVEQSDGVGSAADAGDEQVWQTLLAFEDLGPGLVSHDPVEIADHDRVGVRSVGSAQDVMGRTDVRDPIAHGFVDRFLERLLASLHGYHLGSEHLHAVDVEFLPLAIDRAHVDDALHAEHGRYRGRSHTVLTGSGFGDDPGLAHALGQQHLSHGIVDFMGSGVQQILPLQVDPRSPQSLGQALREIEGSRTSHKLLEVVVEFPLELRILLGAPVLVLQLLERVNEGFGYITPTKRPEVAGRIRQGR